MSCVHTPVSTAADEIAAAAIVALASDNGNGNGDGDNGLAIADPAIAAAVDRMYADVSHYLGTDGARDFASAHLLAPNSPAIACSKTVERSTPLHVEQCVQYLFGTPISRSLDSTTDAVAMIDDAELSSDASSVPAAIAMAENADDDSEESSAASSDDESFKMPRFSDSDSDVPRAVAAPRKRAVQPQDPIKRKRAALPRTPVDPDFRRFSNRVAKSDNKPAISPNTMFSRTVTNLRRYERTRNMANEMRDEFYAERNSFFAEHPTIDCEAGTAALLHIAQTIAAKHNVKLVYSSRM